MQRKDLAEISSILKSIISIKTVHFSMLEATFFTLSCQPRAILKYKE